MEQTAVVPVPRTGAWMQVLRIVKRELDARQRARDSNREWAKNRRERERVNSEDLDLEEWYTAAKTA